MSRMVITLSDDERQWLRAASRLRQQSIAELIREAIRQYRGRMEKSTYKQVIRETSGAWGKAAEDGQAYVDRLRSEWEERR